MINAGTARRNAGSAVKRRRYAGLAIDWASPLIESDRIDALAASARAIAGLRFGSSPPIRPEGCAASPRITFIGIEKRGLVESPRRRFEDYGGRRRAMIDFWSTSGLRHAEGFHSGWKTGTAPGIFALSYARTETRTPSRLSPRLAFLNITGFS